MDSIEPLIFVDNPYQIILYTADQPLVLKRFNYSDGTEANFGLPIWSGQANSLQFDKGFLIAWSEMPGQQQLYVQIAMGGSSYLPVARYEPLLSTLIIPLIIALALLWLTFRVVTSYKREWSRLFHYVDEIDSSRDYRPLRQSNFSEFMRLEHIANRVSFHTHTNKKPKTRPTMEPREDDRKIIHHQMAAVNAKLSCQRRLSFQGARRSPTGNNGNNQVAT